MNDENITLTPSPGLKSDKRYTPTPKLSERKRALFYSRKFCQDEDAIDEENYVQENSDNSLDGLEFHNIDTDLYPGKSNLLKNSSFLSNIEDINDDFLLSADSSNDFEIPIQSPIKNLNSGESSSDDANKVLTFHNVLKSCQKDVHSKKLSKNNSSESIDSNLIIPETPPKSISSNLALSTFLKYNSNESIDLNLVIPETPLKKLTPKTPHETLNTDLELPRINNRKSLISVFKNNDYVSSNDDPLTEKYIITTTSGVQNNLNYNNKDSCIKSKLDSLKRKTDSSDANSSSLNKICKLDDKKLSKARTSLLFPNNDEAIQTGKKDEKDTGLSPKMFYRPSVSPVKKNPCDFAVTQKFDVNTTKKIKNKHQNKQSVFLCGRSKKRNSFGEINAGVRTGIKKPKTNRKVNKSISNSTIKEIAPIKLKDSVWEKKIEIESESILPMDEVLELDELMKKIKSPPILENLRQENTRVNENVAENALKRKFDSLNESSENDSNKENFPSSAKKYKFFKSQVSANESKTVNILKNITLKVENGKMKLQKTRSKQTKTQKTSSREIFDICEGDNKNTNKLQEKIDNIIEKLNKPLPETENTNQVILSAYYSQVKNDNSIILHQPPIESENLMLPDDSNQAIEEGSYNKETEINNATNEVEMLDFSNREVEMKDVSDREIKINEFSNKELMVIQQKLPPSKNMVSKLNGEDMIMSPTSLMCNMTSGLALTSPKKQTITKIANLTNQLDNCPSKEEILKQQQQRVFPVFIKGQANKAHVQESKRITTRSRRIWKTLDERQYQIDAGQKRWGITQCPTCEFVYSQNEPEDEQRHDDFHNKVKYLRFNGWKNEKVVANFDNNQGRIIEIVPGDAKAWWKKVNDLLFVIDKELGFNADEKFNSNRSKVYFYIKNKQIIGFLSAVPLAKANRMIADDKVDCCTEMYYPVKCGISRIWVAQSYRRQHIATRLVDVLRKSYILGSNLNINDFAFSAPTVLGKKFAEKYTNTNTFLIYTNEN